MLNDDLLGAYLDGELDAERRAMVEQQLRLDKAAAARFTRARAADDVLRRAFPAQESGRDLLLADKIMTAQPVSAPREWAKRLAPLAAALVFGLLVGRFVATGSNEQAPYAISAQEERLLDSLPSGRVTEINAGAFEVVLSLQSEAGESCRQFRLTRDMRSTDVLACKRGDEAWRMVAAATAVSVEGYVPAGATSPLDAAIETLGPVVALDAAQEGSEIESGWRHLP